MTASLAFMASFKNGQALSPTQEFALGEINQDKIGQQWSYCMFTGPVAVGQWVQDFRSGNYTMPNPPTGMTAPTIDDRFLYVLRSDVPSAEHIIGAFGFASDVGFVVTDWVAVSETVARIECQLLHHDDGVLDDGANWGPSLTVPPTSIAIVMPGRVATGSNTEDVRGIIQRSIAAADVSVTAPLYGWVLQKGVGFVELGTVAANHDYLNLASGGDLNSAATRSGNTVARPLRTLTTAQANDLILAEINVENNATSPFGRRPKRAIGSGGTVIR